MDERKKKIQDFEAKKQQALEALNGFLTNLGENFLKRHFGETYNPEAAAQENWPELVKDAKEAADYQKLLKDIADSEAAITQIDSDLVSLKALDDQIDDKEKENQACVSTMGDHFTTLGRYLFEDDTFSAVIEPNKKAAYDLLAKIKTQEAQLEELESKGQGNVFSKFADKAKGLTFRTLLAKNRDSLQRVYRSIGEKFLQSDYSGDIDNAELEESFRQIKEEKQQTTDIYAALTGLRLERKQLNDKLNSGGTPPKRKSTLEKQILTTKEKIKTVFKNCGLVIANKDNVEAYSGLLESEDTDLLDKIGDKRQTIAEIERDIEKTNAAIAIDDEKAEIEKFSRLIKEQEQKIIAAERAITEFKDKIDQAEKHIEDLSLKL
ncbi:hypothetical protein ACYULU_13460 [Breznakiellaceae bacterium SP9]